MGDIVKIRNQEYKVKFTYGILDEMCQAFGVPDISDLTVAIMSALGGFAPKKCAQIVYYGVKESSDLTLKDIYEILYEDVNSMLNITTPVANIYFAKTSERRYGTERGKIFADAITQAIDEEKERTLENAKKKLKTTKK